MQIGLALPLVEALPRVDDNYIVGMPSIKIHTDKVSLILQDCGCCTVSMKCSLMNNPPRKSVSDSSYILSRLSFCEEIHKILI